MKRERGGLTRHGVKRVKQRAGIPKGAMERTLRLAKERGKRPEDFEGCFRVYLESQRKEALYVYGGKIWVVNVDGGLITVLNVPAQYRAALRKRELE